MLPDDADDLTSETATDTATVAVSVGSRTGTRTGTPPRIGTANMPADQKPTGAPAATRTRIGGETKTIGTFATGIVSRKSARSGIESESAAHLLKTHLPRLPSMGRHFQDGTPSQPIVELHTML